MSDTSAQAGARGAVADAASRAKERAGEQAQEMAERGRGAIATQVDQRSTQAGDQLRSLSEAVRQSAERLREQDQHGPARLAEQAAQRGERIATYLSESDRDQLLDDVEDVARREPLFVAGAGFLIGMVAARALKASSSRRYQSRSRVGGGSRSQYATGTTGSVEPTLTGHPDYDSPGGVDAPTLAPESGDRQAERPRARAAARRDGRGNRVSDGAYGRVRGLTMRAGPALPCRRSARAGQAL